MPFGFMRKLFGRKKATAKEQLTMSVDEAESLLNGLQQEQEKELLKELDGAHKKATGIHKSMQLSFERLLRATPEEPRAGASRQVKDAFAEKALDSIKSFSAEASAGVGGYEDFAARCKKLVESLRISQKEAAHVKFFFGEELRDAAQSIKEMTECADMMQSLLRKHSEWLAPCRKSLVKIRELQKQAEDRKNEAAEATRSAAEAERQHKELLESVAPVEGLDRARKEAEDAESRLRQSMDKINALFYPVSKALRKYAHKLASKEEKFLIEKYISSPKDAIMHDTELAIAGIIEKSCEKSAEIGLNDREAEKAREFPGRDIIMTMRNEMLSLRNSLEKCRQTLAPLEAAEKENTARTAEAMKMLQKQASLMHQADALEREAISIEDSIRDAKALLSRELSAISGNDIVVL